ncbi:hypothetical protein OGAPHI_005339 [Ogataea philodendri]|uniref:Uncharacterized protein n=1 Tax=Ogataea philodendri TaxID=1378263 RepID=A0A9P8T2N3_9ASCO|nr:uncharacterized protein OGAPHI_005339 [Ogataea philodendri]KAH3663349.1 hypothetical protein OGAPHI_005339 [Ogataea philodendri]
MISLNRTRASVANTAGTNVVRCKYHGRRPEARIANMNSNHDATATEHITKLIISTESMKLSLVDGRIVSLKNCPLDCKYLWSPSKSETLAK